MNQHTKPDLEALARQARMAAVGDAARRTIVHPDHPVPDTPRGESEASPRFELFHFTMSICSQKSRVALLEAGHSFASNELVIMPPLNENYAPEYVQLRMSSKLAKERPLVGSYSGATDVGKEGFDPLVVPTLVDYETNEVIADSRTITMHVASVGENTLIPDQNKDDVIKEIDIVDGLPIAGLFYGKNPAGDHRPTAIQKGMQDAHTRKIEQINLRLEAMAPDHPLRKAYAHKIMKEEAGRKFISDEANMQSLIDHAQNAIRGLDERLSDDRTWATGETFTMADAFWGPSLYRLLYLGYDWMWADLPKTTAYAERTFERSSIKMGVIKWPGHPPGDTIARFMG
ncbi:glutathione S-transferase family protein [Pseudahrensia aquimaris]|uniref:Glutathione S-transferase family protein n=1 Tax=Pseudahrensia aquimaris TaxID=744461 RepID=A0ABW3FAF3_9HYPH